MSKDDKLLTFTGHLTELRSRLIKSFIALAICTGIAFAFTTNVIEFLKAPAPEDFTPIYIEMTEFVATYMKVALAGGIVLAMPILVYQGIMFVSPALTRREKRYVYLALPWITLMFAGGLAFAYFVLVPPATNFLLNWQGFSLLGPDIGDVATAEIRLANYIALVIRFMVAVGIVFETPVITTFLARIGILRPEWLSSKRRWAIIVCFILAAIITPTFDPINQSLVAVPLVILFEMSIILAKIAYRRRRDTEKDYLEE